MFIFGVIFIGGILSQKRRTGYADVPMWAVTASLGTMTAALPMTLKEGIVNLPTLVILVAITLLSGLWLFLDKNRNEV